MTHLSSTIIDRLGIAESQLDAICRRWKVKELALFGSILREDFDRESDVDFLVTFQAGAAWGLWEHMRMESELEHLLGRKVDAVTRGALEASRNRFRKRSILDSAKAIYHAD